MLLKDTIAAISTPIGFGGIGIIRLSGSEAIEISDFIFRSSQGISLQKSPSHRIYHGFVVSPETKERIDEVLVSVMKSPKTYTREDIVEINCHGGPTPLKRILELLLDSGARLAEPGEFTKRAFLNGRLDLIQAEAVCDLINAKTELGRKAALEQLDGNLSREIETLREKVIHITSVIEAYIDFPEEDIELSAMNQIQKDTLHLKAQIDSLINRAEEGRIIREGVKTAIIGRTNVGKSSLLNALLGMDRAIVTDLHGTTRDIIEETINIKGIPIRILDTAGIRSSSNKAEIEGIDRSYKIIQEADLMLFVMDLNTPLLEIDLELVKSHKNVIVVFNKSDLPILLDVESIPKELTTVTVSTIMNRGIEKLKEEIILKVLGNQIENGSFLVTNVRHLKALKKASNSLNNFCLSLLEDRPYELLALDLRDTLDAFGEILGMTTPEDILEKIFKDFCIGK